jgi:hypothetical protein
MAFTRNFHSELNFAFTQCHGIIDDNSLRIHILSFNIEAKGMKNIREIADARKLNNASKITVKGLLELSELANERAAGKAGLLAIIVPDNPMFQKMAELYGYAVGDQKAETRIFHHPREALVWLGYEGHDIKKLLRFMRRHQV